MVSCRRPNRGPPMCFDLDVCLRWRGDTLRVCLISLGLFGRPGSQHDEMITQVGHVATWRRDLPTLRRL